MSNTIWYFGLAPQKERYTAQLSQKWMPNAFDHACKGTDISWFDLTVDTEGLSSNIKNGKVLDDYSRTVYSYRQCQAFLHELEQGRVKDGDAIFLQDYWTPGIEGIFYVLHQRDIKVRLYAMCHAQTVDEFDFTHKMVEWMRHSEMAIKRWIDLFGGGIFVASSIHKEQLHDAGFACPIHVVSLPIDMIDVMKMVSSLSPLERHGVVFASRLHSEKQPEFMLTVAMKYLEGGSDRCWKITTSADQIQTDVPGLTIEIDKMKAEYGDRFKVYTGLSKEEYYTVLCESEVIFNCSLQDYVSWTLLEGIACGCVPLYPAVRSFPECVPGDNCYDPYVDGEIDAEEHRRNCDSFCCSYGMLNSIVNELIRVGNTQQTESVKATLTRSHAGRLIEASLVVREVLTGSNTGEVNVWELPMSVIESINAGYKPKRK